MSGKRRPINTKPLSNLKKKSINRTEKNKKSGINVNAKNKTKGMNLLSKLFKISIKLKEKSKIIAMKPV